VLDPGDAPFHQALANLAASLGNDVEGAWQAAADLRRLLRTDGDARREAYEQLLTGTMEDSLRGALILVIGTLPVPDVDPVLVKALDKFSDNPALVVHLLHALGASREPADLDDIFDMGDQPWGVDGPGGLGITIRRRIEDAALAQVIGAELRKPIPRLRVTSGCALDDGPTRFGDGVSLLADPRLTSDLKGLGVIVAQVGVLWVGRPVLVRV
jgi:hypothetical protein